MTRVRVHRALLITILGLVLQAENVAASTFKVTPVRVTFSGPSSTLLTLRNDSEESLRFQISAFAWSQDAQGGIQLGSTEDISFFPALLALKPGEERKVRVATTVAATDVEKTYRIFFEELPPLDTPKERPAGAQVKILTRMGIPIFVQPAKGKAQPVIDGGKLQAGKIMFDVRNTGNQHFGLQMVKVTGLGANGEQLFDRQAEGWYVLAGSPRTYELEVPGDACAKLKTVVIDAQTDLTTEANAGTISSKFEVPAGACK
jgi:fimbrial chaperone protein